MTSPASTERFSDRVESYVRYRPSYPAELLTILADESGLSPSSVVADIGSGTGISTELLLRSGAQVSGIEPNAPMRQAAERLLAAYPNFTSIDGSAQATTLPDHSVDLVLAAQAFHWFNTPAARDEISRILKPGGHVALVWNVRQLDTTPFLRDYEKLLLDYGTDYSEVRHENIGQEALHAFFIGDYTTHFFPNHQTVDYPALEGRLLSSSYAPAAGHPRHEPMLQELRRIFDLHQANGSVVIEYKTEIYVGR